MTDHLASFCAAMEAVGLAPPAGIEPGKFYRFPGAGKGAGNKSGWFMWFSDGLGGVFGDHASGISESWQAERDRPLTSAEQAALKREIAEAKAKAEAQRKATQDAAAKKAAIVWKQGKPADPGHPYLKKKGIGPHGLKQGGDGCLLVSKRNAAGHIRSLQRISPSGEKRFHPGGQVTGCYFTIGELPAGDGTLLIAEGFATAASLHEATGYPATVAFNTGNLKPVAQLLRKKLPKARLVFCADDDRQTAADTGNNPGITAATEAALAVSGWLAVPDFGQERPKGATDFNDLHQAAGPEAVKKSVAAAVKPDPEKNRANLTGRLSSPSTSADEESAEHEYGGGRFTVNRAGVWFTAVDKDGNDRPSQWICAPPAHHRQDPQPHQRRLGPAPGVAGR